MSEPQTDATEEWAPTCHLRWLVSPTPGDRAELQQLWTKPSPYEGYADEEEWRLIPRESAF